MSENDLSILDSDKEFEEAYNKVRINVMSYFNKNGIIEVIKKRIDDSPIFNFLSERSRKFINNNQPVFNLTIDLTEAIKLYPEGYALVSGGYVNDTNVIDYKITVLMREIVHPILTELAEIFKQGELNDLLMEIPEFSDEFGKDFIISSIFKVEADPSKEKITEVMLKIFSL